jgi:hypothetical protein
MLTTRLLKRFCLLLSVAIIAGCAASGPRFEATAQAPSDKGLVYIYRPGKFMGGGVVFDVHVGPKADNNAIVSLRSGGYFPYYAEPGELELWGKTESTSSVTVDVKAGQTTYVRGSVGVGFLVGRPSLEVVDSATGEKELKDCKLLPPAEAN